MFQDITTRYDLSDATIEIVIMLLGAFILGYLLRYFLKGSSSDQGRVQELETQLATATNLQEQSHKELEGLRLKLAGYLPKPEDLKVVEGIGPKIEGLLKEAGIKTWRDLANADVVKIQDLLNQAGDRYRIHNPNTWPKQARLANDGKWSELDNLQASLNAGRA